MKSKSNKTFICPACGGDVPVNAAACPQCGSDERTGWSDKTYLDGIDIGDDVDYEDLREREFGGESPKRKISWVMIVAIVLLLLALTGFIKMLL